MIIEVCISPPTLTSGGPPRYSDPIPFTMTVSSDIVGMYAPPAVQGPHTTDTCESKYVCMYTHIMCT